MALPHSPNCVLHGSPLQFTLCPPWLSLTVQIVSSMTLAHSPNCVLHGSPSQSKLCPPWLSFTVHTVPSMALPHTVPSIALPHTVPPMTLPHTVPSMALPHTVPSFFFFCCRSAVLRPSVHMLPGTGWCSAGLPPFPTACWWLAHPAAITGVSVSARQDSPGGCGGPSVLLLCNRRVQSP